MLPVVLGHPAELDKQHSVLFGMCDRLRNMAAADDPSIAQDLERGTESSLHRAVTKYTPQPVNLETKLAAADVLKYAVEHFAFEERLMDTVRMNLVNIGKGELVVDYDYHVAMHKHDHAAFLRHDLVSSGAHETHRVSAMALYVFVRHWLICHIGSVDKGLSRWAMLADRIPGAVT